MPKRPPFGMGPADVEGFPPPYKPTGAENKDIEQVEPDLDSSLGKANVGNASGKGRAWIHRFVGMKSLELGI